MSFLDYYQPFWFLGDTMLRINIDPIETCVTKKLKTAPVRLKIWILVDRNLSPLVWDIYNKAT